jgi:transposase
MRASLMSSPREEEEEDLARKLQAREEELQRANAEIALLKQKIDVLVRRMFGKKSEKLDPRQLELLLQLQQEAEALGKSVASSKTEEADPTTPSARPRRAERKERWPSDLPVVEETIDPEAVNASPQSWRCIGAEVSEQLDYQPGRFFCRRLIRRKYVPRDDQDGVPVIAALPESLQERCIAAPGLLAQIIVSKYCDHQPLYRQQQIYQRCHGVHLPRQSMARWMGLAADWLRPIYEQIRTGVMAGGYMQVDETPIRYLAPGHGRTRQGYLWTTSRPGGDVVFDWHTSRAASCLDNIIPVDFTGTLQCDAYQAYRSFAQSRDGTITLAGCWAHVRRKFHEALEQAPRQAGWIVRQIQHLYRIEAEMRNRGASAKMRAAARAHQSVPIHQRIHRALVRLKASKHYLPQSLMGLAIDYTLSQWAMLSVYIGDGRVEIDNNLVENAIRPTAIGKKNWLFIGEAQAGERSAILYTIIETCRRRGIDPHAYLLDILTRLPALTNRQIKDVTPEAWAKSQAPLRAAS